MNLAATAPRTVDELRRRELAFIHVAKAQLAMTDGDYRAMIARFSQGRTDSAGDLGVAERVAVIEHLRAAGAGRPKGRGADEREQASKLRALWRSLYQLGEVEHPDDGALASFVCRQTGIAALRWNRPADLNAGIEALKGWCARIGYVPERSIVKGPCLGRFEPALIAAQFARLASLDAFQRRGFNTLDQWLVRRGYPAGDPYLLPVDHAQDAVRTLGTWLRRLARQQRSAA